MQNTAPTAEFVLQSTIDGSFDSGRYTWEQANEMAAADGFVTVRRLDEVLIETGRA